jgi:diguanylate cyclase (GGDEF)-like protein
MEIKTDMEQISTINWVYIHYGLILGITCAQLFVIYLLNDSTHPPAGLGSYTVYFAATLLCWIAISAQQSTGIILSVDVASIATIITCYILFWAAGQRANMVRGRALLGFICLASCLSGFFLTRQTMFFVESSTIALFCSTVAFVSIRQAHRLRSIGDALIACAAVICILGISTANYLLALDGNLSKAQAIVYAVYSSAYALIIVGFLASILNEYQRHLIQLATEDPLTRLLNRRGLTDALAVSLAVASRDGLTTSAIMVDIDHFKKVNDNFGHEIGDQVIRQAADTLSRMARGSDVISRIGGEEFLLVLPDTPLNSARILAERIRATIDEHPLQVQRQNIHITVSLGVASVEGTVNLDELSEAADRAIYLAKRGGRNRVASVEHKPVQMTTATVATDAVATATTRA